MVHISFCLKILDGMDVSSDSLMLLMHSAIVYPFHHCQTSSLRTAIHCLENPALKVATTLIKQLNEGSGVGGQEHHLDIGMVKFQILWVVRRLSRTMRIFGITEFLDFVHSPAF
jgi:Leucine-rich repeat (LRR) protein